RRRRGRKGVNRSSEMFHQSLDGENSSSASVSNDWKNWVVMQGNDQMVVDDVWGIGKAIRVKFRGDNANMFNVLSRAGNGKQRA
ncbi:sulfate transporter, partial [Trifolium medium]|nr:sulfate transporter [Trifolium medium]